MRHWPLGGQVLTAPTALTTPTIAISARCLLDIPFTTSPVPSDPPQPAGALLPRQPHPQSPGQGPTPVSPPFWNPFLHYLAPPFSADHGGLC